MYIHTEKRIPNDLSDADSQPAAAAAGGAGAKSSTHEHPMTPLRRVAAEHIGKLVRVRVSAGQLLDTFVGCRISLADVWCLLLYGTDVGRCCCNALRYWYIVPSL